MGNLESVPYLPAVPSFVFLVSFVMPLCKLHNGPCIDFQGGLCHLGKRFCLSLSHAFLFLNSSNPSEIKTKDLLVLVQR